MGEPGPGKAARQLQHLRTFFEALAVAQLPPQDALASAGFCLAKVPEPYVFHFPQGGQGDIDLTGTGAGGGSARWFDPRDGQWRDGPQLRPAKITVPPPTPADCVLLVRAKATEN